MPEFVVVDTIDGQVIVKLMVDDPFFTEAQAKEFAAKRNSHQRYQPSIRFQVRKLVKV